MTRVDVSPDAYFDVIALLGDAPRSVLPMTVFELHLYAYLACVLGLFRGFPAASWGYLFAVTSEGVPFSAELETARRLLTARGLVSESEEGFIAPHADTLPAELDELSSLSGPSRRRECLKIATRCALALPIGAVRQAVGSSPGLAAAAALGQNRVLLQQNDVSVLHDEYETVCAALEEETRSLLSPAVLWLSARVLRGEDAR